MRATQEEHPCAGCGVDVTSAANYYGNHGATTRDGQYLCYGCAHRLLAVTAQHVLTHPEGRP